MVRRSIAAVGAMLAAAFVLSGCMTERTEPPQLSLYEVHEYNVAMLDRTWDAWGLRGAATQPAMPEGEPVPFGTWLGEIDGCVRSAGLSMDDFGWSPEVGYYFTSPTAPVATDQSTQLLWYSCLAAHQVDPAQVSYRSREQLDYLYDYFQRWLIPCLEVHEVDVESIPSREDFVSSGGWWVPYYSTVEPLDEDDYTTMSQRCGDPFGGIDPS